MSYDIDLVNALAGALVAAVLAFSFGVVRGSIRRWRTRGVRQFWDGLTSKRISIIQTEYLAASVLTGLDDDIARAAGSGELITKGMGRATANLERFLIQDLRMAPDSVSVLGDKTDEIDHENVVVIGSEVNNHVASAYMEGLRATTNLTMRSRWSPAVGGSAGCVELVRGNLQYRPSTGAAHDDFCLLVRRLPENRGDPDVLLISGCHMYGSLAGLREVTSPALAGAMAEAMEGALGAVAIVKCRVVNGVIDNASHVFADAPGSQKLTHVWSLMDPSTML